MEKEERDERKKGMDNFDKKMDEFKNSGEFSKMSDDKKRQFMGAAMMEMGQNMK